MFESCYLGKIGDVIAGCICHASCATCGYGDWPTDQQDCVTCPEGSKLFVAHMDGTGYCAGACFNVTLLTPQSRQGLPLSAVHVSLRFPPVHIAQYSRQANSRLVLTDDAYVVWCRLWF